jgi:hypothetical protein
MTMLELTPGASDPLIRRTLTTIVDDASKEVGAMLLGSRVRSTGAHDGHGGAGAGRQPAVRHQPGPGTKIEYFRAVLMAGFSGLPAMAGFTLLVTTEAFSEAIESVYEVDAASRSGSPGRPV